jgi:ABC-type transporter lipoprotein component MlaA
LTYVYFFHDVEYGAAAQRTMEAIDYRGRNLERIDELQASSVDYYAVVRSAYQQARRQHIYGVGSVDQNFDDGAFDDVE